MNAFMRIVRSALGQALVESAIVIVVLVWAASWGAWYWNQSLHIGRRPFFYQLYYEPAVMLACHKGFVVAQPQVPAMTKFLQEQVTDFDCKDIPADAKLGTDGLYQGSARYIMTAVGLTWRFTGVSWQKIGPVAGVLFGVAIAAAYGIFRLGMGRVLSALMAWMLSLSALNLLNLPHIRDYSKAPFALVLILLLGLLVRIRPSWTRVLLIAAGYGIVMGIGYGFRTDLLINIPAFPLTALLFLNAAWRPRLAYAAVATGVCLTAFYITAQPVIASVNRTWGCQWHVAILGLGDDETRNLQLRPSAYDWLDGFSDEFTYATATSYAARIQPGVKPIQYCGKEYDDWTRAFMLDVAWHTPADFIVRAYASSLQMVQLPLRWRRAPMPHTAVDYYKIRTAITSHATAAGIFLVGAAVLLIMAADARIGFFLLGFLLYFGGYPAVQFGNRHFFHLEFITWWALGFLIQQVASLAMAKARGRDGPAITPAALRRSMFLLAGSWVALLAVLWIARWYQEAALEPLIRQYANAESDPVTTEEAPGHVQRVRPIMAKPTDPETVDLLEIDLNEAQCPAESKLKFVYDAPHRWFARDFDIRPGGRRETTRIFLPVFSGFQGVTVGDAPPGCLAGIYRARSPEPFTLMPQVTLRPGWETQPLYQSLVGWGIEPPPDE